MKDFASSVSLPLLFSELKLNFEMDIGEYFIPVSELMIK